jgi:FixJ family two-component response regulator
VTNSPKVFIVDDEPTVRESICRLVSAAGYHGTGLASALDLFRELECDVPACVILDFNISGINGLELQDELARKSPGVPIIFLTGFGTVSISVQAMKNGAVDFLTKPVSAQHLLGAIDEAIRRGDQLRRLGEQFQIIRNRLSVLTCREQQVFELVTRGMLNKQAAASLGISEKTIKVHRGRLMKKLGVKSLADLVRISEKLEGGPSCSPVKSPSLHNQATDHHQREIQPSN